MCLFERLLPINGDHAELSHIVGYDKERMVKNIRFENLKINGKVISDDMTGKLHGIKRRTWRVSLLGNM